MNSGMSDHEFLESCFSVRNSSNVDTVLMSHLIVPIFRHSCSPSKFRYKVHPLWKKKTKNTIVSQIKDFFFLEGKMYGLFKETRERRNKSINP